MKNSVVQMASGRSFGLPIYDPLVGEHIASPSSVVGALLGEINDSKIYEPLFKGKKDLTFLDLGANMGLVSIYAADSCKRIVAVEPDPKTFKVLQAATLKLPQIECVCAAVSPLDGPVTFYQNDVNTTASSTVNTFGNMIKVDGLTLSSILRIYQLERVDVCKADIEGGEEQCLTFDELKHAQDVIKSWHIELHPCPNSTWIYKRDVLMGRLTMLGYKVSLRGMTLLAYQ